MDNGNREFSDKTNDIIDGHNKNADLLSDLFSSTEASQSHTINEFADFNQFQPDNSTPINGDNNNLNEDEFADFASAFSDNVPNLQTTMPSNLHMNQPLPQQAQPFFQSHGVTNAINPFINPDPQPQHVFSLDTPLQPAKQHNNLNSGAFSQRPTDLLFDSAPSSNNFDFSSVTPNTWTSLGGNVNINVDNLLDSKYAKTTSPTMNQLAAGVGIMSINTNVASTTSNQPRMPIASSNIVNPVQQLISPSFAANFGKEIIK